MKLSHDLNESEELKASDHRLGQMQEYCRSAALRISDKSQPRNESNFYFALPVRRAAVRDG
jgi:hypothetical protein